MNHSLEVYSAEAEIFFSDGKWLYPLFELEQFLKKNNYDPARLVVQDKIIGRAAALILVYLGVRFIKAELMSKLGQDILIKHHVQFEYSNLVGRIDCRTEEILKDEDDPQTAYKMIKTRAGL